MLLPVSVFHINISIVSGGDKEIDRNDEIRRQSIGCGIMLVLFGATLYGFMFLLVYYDPNDDFSDKEFLWTAEINKPIGIVGFCLGTVALVFGILGRKTKK